MVQNTNSMMSKFNILFFFIFLISCNSNKENELSFILDVKNVEIELSKETSDFGGFGEGYSLEVYVLSRKAIQSFVNKSNRILPKKKDPEKWHKYDWNTYPVDSSYNEVFTMGLNYSNGDLKLEKYLIGIKKTLLTPNIYCAFYYKPDERNPQDIELYILDIKTGKLYLIKASF